MYDLLMYGAVAVCAVYIVITVYKAMTGKLKKKQ